MRSEIPGEVEIQKLLIDFEEKPYKLLAHVRYWLGQILGSPLQLKCKGIRPMDKTYGMFKNQMVWPGARRFLEERKELARN